MDMYMSSYPRLTTECYSQPAQVTTNGPQNIQQSFNDKPNSTTQEHNEIEIMNASTVVAAPIYYRPSGLTAADLEVFTKPTYTVMSMQPDSIVTATVHSTPHNLSFHNNHLEQNTIHNETVVLCTPPEILIKIFSEFYNDSTYTFEVGDKENIAFIVSHVCHQWCSTAIDLCAAFWTPLTIVRRRSSNQERTIAWTDLTSMAIHRSKSRKLKIMFVGSDDELMAPSLAGALRVIIAESQCLEILNLYLPLAFIPMLLALEGRVPNLRRCAVHTIGNNSTARHHINAFAVAPLLKRLTFASLNSRSTFSVPRTSITFYEDLHDCYASDYVHDLTLQNLRFTPHMWYFRAIYQQPRMDGFMVNERAIECPGIHIFIASQGALFRSVILPFVRSIIVESNPPYGILDFTDQDCFPSVYNLIIRSQCHTTLTHLAVYDTLLTEDIINVLSELPFLKELAFHFT
ncbi:uncharacterized protein EV420DRAFT_1477352 [Desarmillaria tabescens]|uniref:F-box domain-containing protein n=1 Tax=Armillaria tabescens TaxID=1929756 RepID=A0AA39NBP4_ARMTA|nr:uncharacterized protein EV420DRAFT_1477352 [Desarmillaria tabescens]KAK0462662.1 hypothetical protein EV420DRAFT_1477352 [Desarmillaria tabescens]